jgi:hypothetical protein
MNISNFLVSCFLAVSLVFAQSSKKSNPKEGASGSGSPKEKTVFDSLRGHAYNPYSIQGAATTVEDLFTTPSDIYGHKFFYVSPTDKLGYAAFDFLGGSGLFGLDNSATLAALRLGYATPGFGIALYYSVAKTWFSWKQPDQQDQTRNDEASSRTTYPGDNVRLHLSLPIGSAKLYANGGWLTDAKSWVEDIDGDQHKLDVSTIDAKAGLTGTAGSLSYDGYLLFKRIGGTYTNIDGEKFISANTLTTLGLGVDLGFTALRNSSARVIVGLNNLFDMASTDKIKNGSNGDNIMRLVISPNILAEVVLCENWLAFAGATNNLTLQFGNGDGDDNTSYTSLQHDRTGTQSFVGIRWQKTSWALEAQVTKNPFEALNGVNTFANFSGFIYF